MSLIAILISLALEKLLPSIEPARQFNWFMPFTDWIRIRLNRYSALRGSVALLLTVLLPVIAVALLHILFLDILLFLGFLFSIVILTYCLGPDNPLYAAHRFIDASDRQDDEQAQRALTALMHEMPVTPATRYADISQALLIETHERITGILFWFIVLGPMGAVLYRLSVAQRLRAVRDPLADSPEFSAAALKLHALLAWIPARLTALTYGVMGSFTHALQAWPSDTSTTTEDEEQQADTPKNNSESHQLLVQVGLGALQLDDYEEPMELDNVRETYGLCSRTLIAWLTILGLLTLAGWVA